MAGWALVAGVCAYGGAVFAGGDVGERDGFLHWPLVIFLAVMTGSFVLRASQIRAERRAWAVLSCGAGSYTLAVMIWIFVLQRRDTPPYPSLSDALWLAFYPAAYAAFVMLLRRRVPQLPRAVVLDGLVAAFALAAIATVFVAPAAAMNSRGLGTLAQVTTFAYPLLDLTLLAVVGFGFVVTGGRPGRAFTLAAVAIALVAVADGIWSYQVAGLLGGTPALPNFLWAVAWVVFAFAPWQPPRQAIRRPEGRIATSVPVVFAVVALGVLVFDHFERLNPVAVVLAAVTCVVAMLRTLMTVAEERALAESRRQAMTDELTGLPNRRAFLGRLAEGIEAARESGGSMALLMIDLDRFKELNDTLGHAAGDELLVSLGPRLRDAVGRQGRLARLGGDEFGVILPGADAKRAAAVGAALRVAIEQPFDVRGLRVNVGASLGLSLFPLHAASGEELLQRADVAMYQAKRTGGGLELYAAERDEHSRDRLLLASDLRNAILEDGLSVHYQAKAGTSDGVVGAVEALVRWEHPWHGAIPPCRFVPIAEQTGLGRALTRRVLEHATRQAARWQAQGRALRVAINLCADDLRDLEFPNDVARALARCRLPAELLQVEVTENAVLVDPLRAQLVLARLAELGVQSSLDDFGTGHSSLTHLRRLPVREIKLDRSFVAGMVTDRQDATIVRSTVDLARNLGLRVVAEGVEDELTWDLLRDLGCDEVQGYLVSQPLAAPAFDAWLWEREALRDRLPVIQDAGWAGR